MTSRHIASILRGIFLSVTFYLGTSTHAFSAPENTSPKIVAVGDIHGDYEAYITILNDAGLIDGNLKWAGGDTILVQTGDIPDRGPDTLEIIQHLRAIQKQAKKKGGKVIALIGNHEVLNMTRDLRYVVPGEYKAFETPKSSKLRDQLYAANKAAIKKFYLAQNPALTPKMIRKEWDEITPLGKIEHQAAWSPSGEIGKWVLKNSAVTMVEGYIFVHGGISQKYSERSLNDINKQVKAALKAQDETFDSIINDPLGPLWYRGYTQAKKSDGVVAGLSPEEELTTVLRAYGAKGLIVGHTPSTRGIKASYGGRLVQIDTGASKYYGGTRSFLQIENGKLYANDNGTKRPLN